MGDETGSSPISDDDRGFDDLGSYQLVAGMTDQPDRIMRVMVGIAIVLLGLTLTFMVVVENNRPTTEHQLQRIEKQLDFIACMMVLPFEERTALNIAECTGGLD